MIETMERGYVFFRHIHRRAWTGFGCGVVTTLLHFIYCFYRIHRAEILYVEIVVIIDYNIERTKHRIYIKSSMYCIRS